VGPGAFHAFEFSAAVQALYTFFSGRISATGMSRSRKGEASGERRHEGELPALQEPGAAQRCCLLHPFHPVSITEELWHLLATAGGEVLEDARLENASQIATNSLARASRSTARRSRRWNG